MVATPNTSSSTLALEVENPVMSVRIGVMKVNAEKLAPKPRIVTDIIAQIAGLRSAANWPKALPVLSAGCRGSQSAVASSASRASNATA
ncbi:hypothetical protein D3C76_1007210 [compost metagenome]